MSLLNIRKLVCERIYSVVNLNDMHSSEAWSNDYVGAIII